MSFTDSLMGLHLRYRLWIAEMNSDINVLRIFEDYLIELALKKNEPEVKEGIDNFHLQFINLRQVNDQLRHEMHLEKMQLAASVKETAADTPTISLVSHEALKKRYTVYRKDFDKLKTDFEAFEGQWLQ